MPQDPTFSQTTWQTFAVGLRRKGGTPYPRCKTGIASNCNNGEMYWSIQDGVVLADWVYHPWMDNCFDDIWISSGDVYGIKMELKLDPLTIKLQDGHYANMKGWYICEKYCLLP